MKETIITTTLFIATLLQSCYRYQEDRAVNAYNKQRTFDSLLVSYNDEIAMHTALFMEWISERNEVLSVVLNPSNFVVPEKLNECLAQVRYVEDSAYSYLYETILISNSYGNKLMLLCDKARVEEKFVEKWKTYEYIRLDVRSKFGDYYSRVGDLCRFLKENESHYTLKRDSLLFDNDSIANSYESLVGEIYNAVVDAELAKSEPDSELYYEEAVAVLRKSLK